MRVALPDSSAVEPSGFQMTTSAQSSPRADDLDDAVGVTDVAAHVLGVERLLRHEIDVPVRVPAFHRQSS